MSKVQVGRKAFVGRSAVFVVLFVLGLVALAIGATTVLLTYWGGTLSPTPDGATILRLKAIDRQTPEPTGSE